MLEWAAARDRGEPDSDGGPPPEVQGLLAALALQGCACGGGSSSGDGGGSGGGAGWLGRGRGHVAQPHALLQQMSMLILTRR